MPLKHGRSRKVISRNIEEMREAGYPEDQAVAAAMRVAHDNPKHRKGHGRHMHKAVRHLNKEARQ